MNLQDKAMHLLAVSDCNVLVIGKTGAGKTTLIKNSKIPNSRYFDFYEIAQTFHLQFESAFLESSEKTLILDCVEFPDDLANSQLVRLIKTIRKKNKRLIVVAYPGSNTEAVTELFGVVIRMEMSPAYSIESSEEKAK